MLSLGDARDLEGAGPTAAPSWLPAPPRVDASCRGACCGPREKSDRHTVVEASRSPGRRRADLAVLPLRQPHVPPQSEATTLSPARLPRRQDPSTALDGPHLTPGPPPGSRLSLRVLSARNRGLSPETAHLETSL